MSGFLQSIITVVLFILILGSARDHPRARPLRDRPPGQGPGPRVRDRLPAAGEGPALGGETLYTLNWLPIGGFVKLEGEDGDDADDPRSFAAQRLPTKMLHPRRRRGDEHRSWRSSSSPGSPGWRSPFVGVRFFEVQPGSPAAAAGLQAGDAIVAVDGEHYQFITGPNAVIALRERAGDTVVLDASRDPSGARRDVPVTLRPAVGDQRTAGSARDLRCEQAVRGLLLRRIHAERPADRDPGRRPRDGALDGPDRRRAGRVSCGSVANDPTAPPPVAGPVGIATQIGDIFWNSGPIMHALRRGHPVGQPRRREHPAVPAARRRPDADDHAQARSSVPGSACAPSS